MNLNLMVFIQKIIYPKDETYVISLDDFKSIGTHWIDLYENSSNILYFFSFVVEHIPKEI